MYAFEITKESLPIAIELGDEEIADIDTNGHFMFIGYDDGSFEVTKSSNFNRRHSVHKSLRLYFLK